MPTGSPIALVHHPPSNWVGSCRLGRSRVEKNRQPRGMFRHTLDEIPAKQSVGLRRSLRVRLRPDAPARENAGLNGQRTLRINRSWRWWIPRRLCNDHTPSLARQASIEWPQKPRLPRMPKQICLTTSNRPVNGYYSSDEGISTECRSLQRSEEGSSAS